VRQTNASAALEEDLLEVALIHERLARARVRSSQLDGLTRTAFVTLLGIFVSAIVVNEVFYWTLRKEIQSKRLAPTNALLTATRAREQSLLTRYQWVKKSDGVLRIPAKRAASLIVADYAHPVPTPSDSSTISAPLALSAPSTTSAAPVVRSALTTSAPSSITPVSSAVRRASATLSIPETSSATPSSSVPSITSASSSTIQSSNAAVGAAP
jgi:hypothetical protein